MKLTETQEKVLEKLVASGITEKFYLAGGTALMMRYNHRFSGDFDFFSRPREEFDVRNKIPELDNVQILDEKKDTMIFIKDSIKCSFFEYDYPLLRPLVKLKGYGISVASDEDITSMKAIAIIQRGEKKDFFDLWTLMVRNDWSLEDITGFCEAKYGERFNPSLLLKALTFFEDAEKDKIADIDLRWDDIKNYFIILVKEFMRGERS